MIKSPIHQTPEEKIAIVNVASLNTLKDIDSSLKEVAKELLAQSENTKDKDVEITAFTGIIENQKKIVSKMDEVKSASLIANKLLKEIKETKTVVSLEGINAIAIKGNKGDKGEKGDKGDSITGPQGKQGTPGVDGRDGVDGKDGADSIVPGPQGIQGNPGKDGTDGKDGSDGAPDTPEEVVGKINKSPKKVLIDFKKVRGLEEAFSQINKYGSNPGGSTGGANRLNIQNQGTNVSDYITAINFSTGLIATYSNNGLVTITSSGGGGLTQILFTETPDDTRVNYTVIGILVPTYVTINGQRWRSGSTTSGSSLPGNVVWTYSGGVVTIFSPVGQGGDIYAEGS